VGLRRRAGTWPASDSAEESLTASSGDVAQPRDVAAIRRVFDAIPVGVVIAEQGGAISYRNRTAQALDGHGGVLVSEAVDRTLAAALGGASENRTVELFGPPKRIVAVSAEPLDDGGAWASIDDISESVRLDAIRTDFVANISHEMKTPVGAMAVLAEAIADSDDIVTMRRLASKMVVEAHRVSSAIDDLLELSRIEIGGADADVVAVELVVHEAMQRCAEPARQRGLRLLFDHAALHGRAQGDSRQLVSALTNLLDNAIKYSAPDLRDGAERDVVRIVARSVGSWIDVAVIDRGVGIPARDLDRIFERFYRVDRARSRDTGGTGLGLAIVRHVATNHRGEVSATSQEGEGSTFTLRIPAYQPVQRATA
jgi:two-component system, OmpR family, sensor histidine kinase SenX3